MRGNGGPYFVSADDTSGAGRDFRTDNLADTIPP